MADSRDFPRNSDALAFAIAQLLSDRRALAEEADRTGAREKLIRPGADAQTGLREHRAYNESSHETADTCTADVRRITGREATSDTTPCSSYLTRYRRGTALASTNQAGISSRD